MEPSKSTTQPPVASQPSAASQSQSQRPVTSSHTKNAPSVAVSSSTVGSRRPGPSNKPSTIICNKAKITGNVHFGENCIVHNECEISADGGDIIFGDYCIIEEYCIIKNMPRKDKDGNFVKKTMRIGNYNVFEAYCQVNSSEIGNLNEFGIQSKINAECKVCDSCVLAPRVQLQSRTQLPNQMVVYDDGRQRKNMQSKDIHRKQVVKDMCQVLATILPMHNTIKQEGGPNPSATDSQRAPSTRNQTASGNPASQRESTTTAPSQSRQTAPGSSVQPRPSTSSSVTGQPSGSSQQANPPSATPQQQQK